MCFADPFRHIPRGFDPSVRRRIPNRNAAADCHAIALVRVRDIRELINGIDTVRGGFPVGQSPGNHGPKYCKGRQRLCAVGRIHDQLRLLHRLLNALPGTLRKRHFGLETRSGRTGFPYRHFRIDRQTIVKIMVGNACPLKTRVVVAGLRHIEKRSVRISHGRLKARVTGIPGTLEVGIASGDLFAAGASGPVESCLMPVVPRHWICFVFHQKTVAHIRIRPARPLIGHVILGASIRLGKNLSIRKRR